jgi:hypothetical protein
MGRAWPLERVLFALLAGLWFLLLAAFVGLNQWLFVVGGCPASLLLEHVGIQRRCRP